MTAGLPLAIAGLRKRYGTNLVLDDVSLDIEAGEFLTLLGPSGSGKTTLLMALAGFAAPDAGSIRFGDAEMRGVPAHRRGVGVVFQSYALFPFLTVAQNVAYPLKVRRMPRDEIAARVTRALRMVRMQDLGDRSVRDLSGGQRQRVAIARAIVFEPRLILMDEPLSALDKKLREQMQGELRELHRALGVTIVYVTHDQREALTLSDRIAVMNAARIVQVDTPERLYRRPANRFVADFIGDAALLSVTVAEGQVHLAGAAIGPAPVSVVRDGTPNWLVLRPEKLLHDMREMDTPHLAIEATVSDVMFEGHGVMVMAATATGAPIRYRLTGLSHADTPRPGQPITLRIACDDALLVGDA